MWWTEELCSQQPSLVGDWSRVLGFTQLVSHVLGAMHYKERLSLQNKSNWVLDMQMILCVRTYVIQC